MIGRRSLFSSLISMKRGVVRAAIARSAEPGGYVVKDATGQALAYVCR